MSSAASENNLMHLVRNNVNDFATIAVNAQIESTETSETTGSSSAVCESDAKEPRFEARDLNKMATTQVDILEVLH